MELKEKAEKYLAEISDSLLSTKEELENFRLRWLSKKGEIPSLFSLLKDVPAEEKKSYGEIINNLKVKAEYIFESFKESIEKKTNAAQSASVDTSLDAYPLHSGSLHPLTIVRNRIADIFANIGFAIAEDDDIVDDWHNFTALNIAPDHPARDMADTFFIKQNPDIVLRTHTSPVQIKLMETQPLPIRSIMPGRVYRKDSDATHSPNFHQVEGLYVDEKVSFADLKQTLYYFVQEMFGEGTEIRFRPSYFPFTEVSAEMDILWKKADRESRWLEIMGCGMVDPNVLENCKIDSNKYTGFAFGMGIERIAMVKYNITDIRLFYENDLRFLNQFTAE